MSEWFVVRNVSDVICSRPITGWLWDGILLPGTTTLLAGHWRLGKSTLIIGLLGAMYRREPYLGLDTTPPGRVVYFTEEGPYSLRGKVMDVLHPEWPVSFWQARPGTRWYHVLQTISCLSNCLVVIDTISEFAAVRDENSIEFGLRARELSRIVRESDVSCLVVHHTTKWGAEEGSGRGVRGHTSFPAVMDVVLLMLPERDEDGGVDPNRGYLLTRSRFAETPSEIAYEYHPAFNLLLPRDRPHHSGPSGRYSPQQVVEAIRRYGGVRKAATVLGISPSQVSRLARRASDIDED